ncbi:immunity protein TriTu family protein, partial [Salmonella enterica]
MLNKFKLWVSKHTDYTVIHNENDLSYSIIIDFEDDRYISRFTVWDDLSCMSEVMD